MAMTGLISFSSALCVAFVLRPVSWKLILGAVFAGLGVATKWTAWPIIVTLGLATYLGWLSLNHHKTSSTLTSLWVRSGFGFAIGLVVGGFQLFIMPAAYLTYAITELQSGQAGGFGIWQIDDVSGWQFYVQTLVWGLGIVLLGLAIWGLAKRISLGFRRRDAVSIMVLSFPLIYFLIMGFTRHYFARYALPLVSFLAFFAAEATLGLSKLLIPVNTNRRNVFVACLAALAMVQPAASSLRHDILLTRDDTRTLAKEWIEANIPEGASVAADWPIHGPPLKSMERDASTAGVRYELAVIGGSGLADHALDWYLDQGVDYIVSSSSIYSIELVDKSWNAERLAFYASLDEGLELQASFYPNSRRDEQRFIFDEIYGPAIDLWDRNRPGPTIKVYSTR